ncbi:MAG TPA: protein kinase [Polyangiaceae bacterium]|nr:protein kinase [Polyangiaceae bacterium]
MLPRIGRYEVLLEQKDEGFVSRMTARMRGPNVGPRVVELARVEHALAREVEVRATFLAEARAAARVRHANFVQPIDTLVAEGDLYASTEFTLGVRFDELVRAASVEHYEIPLPVSLRILLDVVSGLSALHASEGNTAGSRPIVHGDVCPTNIVVSYRGEAKVVHSGLSAVTSRVGAIGERNARLAYKAPEQLRTGLSAAIAGPSADVFSVGVLLWEVLMGERLFDAPSDVEVVDRVLNAPIPAADNRGGRYVPLSLLPVVSAALDRNPERRPESAAALGEALEAAPGVRLATTEEVALVVDQLVGKLIEKRREQLEALISQSDESSHPSESSFRAEIDAHLVRAPQAKTPVGIVYPPQSPPPPSPRSRQPTSDKFVAASPSLPRPPRSPASSPSFPAAPPASSRPPSTPRSPARVSRPDSGPPAAAPSETPQSPVGWVYYIALGAIVGTLAFVIASGPARRAGAPANSTAPPTSTTTALPSFSEVPAPLQGAARDTAPVAAEPPRGATSATKAAFVDPFEGALPVQKVPPRAASADVAKEGAKKPPAPRPVPVRAPRPERPSDYSDIPSGI